MNHRWRLFSITMALGLVLAACGPGQSAAPSAPDASQPAPSVTAFEATAYPEDGPAECGTDTNPTFFSRIEAVDELTVRFTLCQPDVAFLSKVAFTPFAINDTAWLEEHVPDGSIVSEPNGTGPYMIPEGGWARGDSITFEANPDYWGDPAIAETLVFRWSAESAQRVLELQAGSVDGIDNPGPEDFETIGGDENLQLLEREGLNTFYIGFNNTSPPFDNLEVRQAIAMGIDRQRLIDTFYPPGSEVASHFTPCAIPFACEGDEWYEYDPDAAREMLAPFLPINTQIHLRDVVRGYLPQPPIVAQDIADQLADLGITATVDIQESGTFIANADAGNLPGLHLLGWGADYPDATNFLDFHFGAGASDQFGDKHPEITEPLQQGATNTDEETRRASYEEANNAIRELVPMIPVAHAGSATAFQADVTEAHASPLSNEYFAVMDPGGRDTIVWMQNAEPIGIYCADETDGESLRVCEQVMEPLYAFEVGGTDPIPMLAEECTSNDELTEWTCTLREGVTFHNGATLDANDVVLSYAVQWDAEHPLHAGNTSAFTYFSALWSSFLNPPPEE